MLKQRLKQNYPFIYVFLEKLNRGFEVFLHALKCRLVHHSVRIDDTQRLAPVSRQFGFDRGTPIDRRYIEIFLEEHSRDIHGVALEVADTAYTMQFGGEAVVRSEVIHKDSQHLGVTIQGDLESPDSLPPERVDVFICTQTLPFLFDVQAAVQGAHKVLKVGGVFLCTFPSLTPISRYDADRWGDFWRFTPMGVERLIKQVFGNAEVHTYGNCLAAKAFLDGLAVEDFMDPSVLDIVDPDYPIIIAVKAVKDTLGQNN